VIGPNDPTVIDDGATETAPPLVAEVRPGQVLGGFEVQDEIGRGGMAVVYRARQPSLNRVVALKVLAPWLARDPQAAQRFAFEATTAARLEHPSIVTVYDSGAADGFLFLAMRYMAGGTLAQLISRGERLSTERILTFLREIGSALDYAHGAGVVHRDVKPANVLLDPHGRAGLADFGIATVLDPAERVAHHTARVGTIAYIAPEQAQGQAVAASDLYSLGVVAYQLFSGQTPFHGETGLDIMDQHLHTPPPDLFEVRPDLPRAVGAAITRMLDKVPEERFPTAAAFVAALSEAVSQPVAERIKARTGAIRGRLATNSWLPWAAISLGVMLVAVAGFLLLRPASVPLPPACGLSALAPTPNQTGITFVVKTGVGAYLRPGPGIEARDKTNDPLLSENTRVRQIGPDVNCNGTLWHYVSGPEQGTGKERTGWLKAEWTTR
jgi:hypothetical protein